MTFSEKTCNTCGQKCAIKYHGCSNWISMQSGWIPVSERLPEERTCNNCGWWNSKDIDNRPCIKCDDRDEWIPENGIKEDENDMVKEVKMSKEKALKILAEPGRAGVYITKANDENAQRYNAESMEAWNMAIAALRKEAESEVGRMTRKRQ